MHEETKPTATRKFTNNIIPFPDRRPRIEVWQIIYVGQSNDGWIRQTVVLRGKGERDPRHLTQDNNPRTPPKKDEGHGAKKFD